MRDTLLRRGALAVALVGAIGGTLAVLRHAATPSAETHGMSNAPATEARPAAGPATPHPAPAGPARPSVGDGAAPDRAGGAQVGQVGGTQDGSAIERELMERARRALEHAPGETLALIAEADGRFGGRHEARRELEIRALVGLGRIGEAHARTDRFYRAFPESPARHALERLTGYHPRPTGPGQR